MTKVVIKLHLEFSLLVQTVLRLGLNVFTLSCRVKIGGNQSESQLISQLQHGLALEFERSDPARKLRLLLSEILFVLAQVNLNNWIHNLM